jgi:hypothetical protein
VNHSSAMNIGVYASPNASNGSSPKATKKTLIVTGIARSGTSLVASLLKEAGVFIGEFMHEVVNEDAQIIEFLRSQHIDLLKTLIRQRNTKYPRWGFKAPDLHAFLRYQDLSLFRNPHLIVIYRDPVAVAIRNALSEHVGELDALVSASNGMHSLAQFVKMANCPLLLLSYEKALTFPNIAIDSLVDFCGLQLDDNTRNRMFLQVQPNRAEYLAAATRHFSGCIDGILDGQLYGWCLQVGRMEPVRLDLFADDRLIETFLSDRYREDLAHGGVGNGCHGFFVDLTPYGLRGDAVIRVKVNNRVLELDNSGQPLGRFDVQMTGL